MLPLNMIKTVDRPCGLLGQTLRDAIHGYFQISHQDQYYIFLFNILLMFLDGEHVGLDRLAELICSGMILLVSGNYHFES